MKSHRHSRNMFCMCAAALVMVMMLSACGQQYGKYELSEPQSTTEDDTKYNDTLQLTEEDIQAKNNGQALFVYGDEGYVTTLVGRYSDEKINDYEDAVASLNGVARLIGLSAGSEYFCVYGETDDDGYTYYTFQQRYGKLTLQYATLRVVVDPSGYTAGLSSSFTPNVGIAKEESGITAGQAEAVVRSTYPDDDLQYYTDYTQQLALTYNNRVVNCYAIYTSNPGLSTEFDMMYLEHFVAYSGEYLTCVPTSSLDTKTENAYKADEYFKNLTSQTYTGTVTLADGTKIEITVPVAYNSENGMYYLGDISRKIMVADYYAFNYNNSELSFISSSTNSGWQDNHLLAYSNYIKAYDFYADMGIRSVDGFETPILITVDWCDENRNPVDNACYYGINSGWACFGVSNANHYSDSLDITGHEFTHGVTRYSMCGMIYANETGAINESYSDIMGNLIEMRSGATTDGSWLVGETSGSDMRCMSDPGRYEQPEFVGDTYYIPCVTQPNASSNDYGGVHVNNSLASLVAYKLYASGMSLSQEASLWLTSIELMTPYADYDDLYACLIFSARINGLEAYTDTITQAFSELGLAGDRTANARNASKDGYGRISFSVSSKLAAGAHRVSIIRTTDNATLCWTSPDQNGKVTILLPAGNYGIAFSYVTTDGSTVYCYQNGGWKKATSYSPVTVTGGKTVTIQDLS